MKLDSKSNFGSRLRLMRRIRLLTQMELAEKLGVSVSAVSQWEKGVSYPLPTHLQGLCNVLGVSPKFMLAGEDEKEIGKEAANAY